MTQTFDCTSDRLAVMKILEITSKSNNLCAHAMKKLIASGVKLKVSRDKIKLPQCPVPSNVYTISADLGQVSYGFIMARSPIPKSDNSPKAREFLYFADSVLNSSRVTCSVTTATAKKEQKNGTTNKSSLKKVVRHRKIYQAS